MESPRGRQWPRTIMSARRTSKPRTDWAASAVGVRFQAAGRSRGGSTSAPMGGERVKAPPVWKDGVQLVFIRRG